MVNNRNLCGVGMAVSAGAYMTQLNEKMTVLVYGLGRSGTAVCELLRQQQHDVIFYDAKPQNTQALIDIGCTATETPLDVACDICIAAPGVPFDQADLVALRSKGVETIGEVEWVYRSTDADIIAITATAGKTTTTQWLHDVLASTGVPVEVGGNIDPALSKVVQTADETSIFVTEMSSFGLERSIQFKPHTAIVLNLARDHIDRHGTVEEYWLTKKKIIENLDAESNFIYSLDDPELCKWAQELDAKGVNCFSFSTSDTSADAYLQDTVIYLNGQPLISTTDLTIEGHHVYGNALAVALAAQLRGLSFPQIAAGLKAFEGVAGRYNYVSSIEQQGTLVSFIEDSIATRELAVKAALESTPSPIVWILGGQDKGANFEALHSIIREKVSLAITIGDAGEHFASELDGIVEVKHLPHLDGDKALEAACNIGLDFFSDSQAATATVLLAPMAASFDQFANYKERARSFRNIVERLSARSLAQAAEDNTLKLTGMQELTHHG